MPKRRWIRRAVHRPGALRRAAAVSGTQRIPRPWLQRAAKGAYGPQTARRARFALELRGFQYRRRRR